MQHSDYSLLLGHSNATDKTAVDSFVQSSTISHLHNWIQSQQHLIYDSVRKAKQNGTAHMHTISYYFSNVTATLASPQPTNMLNLEHQHINRLQEPPDSTLNSLTSRIQTNIRSFFRSSK